ncbi:hypothetical protein [Haloferula sp.]|uniref:hypothetical protein n=1 Tax=Haloferula sp. TaxID=2497595 RepID=UPI00329D67AA
MSFDYNGSPGVAGAGIDGRIVISEILSHSGLPAVDVIELFNPGESLVTVGGWLFTDSNDPINHYHSFTLPSLTLNPGDFHAMPGNSVSSYSATGFRTGI